MLKFLYSTSTKQNAVRAAAFLPIFLFGLHYTTAMLHETAAAHGATDIPPGHILFQMLPDSHIQNAANLDLYPFWFQSTAVFIEGEIWNHQLCVDTAMSNSKHYSTAHPTSHYYYSLARIWDSICGTFLATFAVTVINGYVAKLCFNAKSPSSPVFVLIMLNMALAFLGDLLENVSLLIDLISNTTGTPDAEKFFIFACYGVPFKLTFAFVIPPAFQFVGACLYFFRPRQTITTTKRA